MRREQRCVCVRGVRSVRESRRRQAIASGEGELEREGRATGRGCGGVKGRGPDACSYLNLQLLAEVTAEAPFILLGYELPARAVRSS